MARLGGRFALSIIIMTICFAVNLRAQEPSAQQIEQLRVALQSDPENIGVRLQLINLLFMNGHYREVIDVTRKAIDALPERSSLYFFTGESFKRLGEFDSAYIFLKKGYQVRPYLDLSESYGMVLLRLRKIDEATPILQSVAKVKTEYLDNHLSDGSLAYNSGKLEKATDEFLAVSIIDKNKLSPEQSTFLKFSLNFQSYVASSNTDAAVDAFESTLKARFGNKYEFTSIGEVFRCLIDQKQIEPARNLFEDLNKVSPAEMSQGMLDRKFFSMSYSNMVQCPKLKDTSKALFRRVSQAEFGLPLNDLAALFSLYDFMLGQGATQLAADLSNEVMDTVNVIKEPYLRMAEIFMHSNRSDDAIKSIRSYFMAAKIDDLGYTNDFVQSFRTVMDPSKSDEAIKILNQLSRVNVQELSATYVTLGDLFTKMGNGERAIAILNKVLVIDPGNPTANLKLGEAYYFAGHYDDIIKSLSNTTDQEGLKYLALAYEKKVMLPESNDSWQKFLVLTTDTAQINNAKEHIRQNTIVLMSPQYQQLRAQAAAATRTVQLAVTRPAGAVEDNTRGIALVTTDNTLVTFEGYAGSDSPIDTIMINGMIVPGVAPTPDETNDSHITKPYIVKFSTNISLPAAQKSEVQIVTADSLGNRAVKNYLVDVQAQKAATGSLPTIRAFVVGISQYADKSLSLKYAEDDANLFYQRMRDPSTIGIPASNITLLTNTSATRAAVLEGLESVLESSFENDVIMIYLAMHGVTDEGLLYFIPYDAKVTKLSTTAISGLDFDSLIKTKGAGRKVIMFVDACHAGAAGSSLVFGGTRAVQAMPILLTEMAKSRPGLSVFSASDAGQVSREGEQWGGHGVFTYYLLKAMTTPAANTNADQFLQLREIVDYVRDRVSADTKGKQTPVFKCFGCDPDMPLFYSK